MVFLPKPKRYSQTVELRDLPNSYNLSFLTNKLRNERTPAYSTVLWMGFSFLWKGKIPIRSISGFSSKKSAHFYVTANNFEFNSER